MKIHFCNPTDLLAKLPATNGFDEACDARVLVAHADRLSLRRPDFLVTPEYDEERLRRSFDIARLDTPDLWACILHDVAVLGENVVVLPDGRFIEGALWARSHAAVQENAWWSDLRPLGEGSFESSRLDRLGPTIAEPALFLAGAGMRMYHHWLFDGLARLVLLDEDERRRLKIVVSELTPSPLVDLLGLFGISSEQVVRLDFKMPMCFRHLILLPRIATAETMLPKALDYVRRTVLRSTSPTGQTPRNILVTRRDAPQSHRQLVNEGELIALFRSRGYEVLAPGTRSVLEQAIAFHRAERIAAVHGSGAANVLFCSDSASVMHLHPADHVFFRQHGQVSAIRDQCFGFVFGECFSRAERAHGVDWIMDIDAVEETAAAHDFW